MGAESLATAHPQQQGAAIIEFESPPTVIEDLRGSLDQFRAAPAWETLKTTLRHSQPVDAGTRLRASSVLRQAQASSLRDAFFRDAGPIKDDLDRTLGSLLRIDAEALHFPTGPLAITQTCWLNRTVRTVADPRALAEIATASEIQRLDVPRRLEADLHVSAQTVGAPSFRERTGANGTGITVAVIDSEVALGHPALRDRTIHKRNFTQEPWGTPGDHGTAVAGIVAGRMHDFAGIAPEAVIYAYKVLATNRFLNATNFDGWLAIQQALEDGALVANCSWGAGPANQAHSKEEEACDTAWALGLAVVKSAGNKGPGVNTLTTPADAHGIIVVGATDREGSAVQNYSSRGPAPDGETRPHLVAPGGSLEQGILSTQVGGGIGDVGAGTSYAAPHVSGMLALILEQDPELSPDELRDMLVGSCTPLVDADDNAQGAGLVSIAGLQV